MEQQGAWFVVTDRKYLANLVVCSLKHYVTGVVKQLMSVALAS